MKITILITASLLLVTQVFAKGVYVGVNLESVYGKQEIEIKARNYNKSRPDSAISQGLKIGYYFSENSRSYTFFRNVNVKDGKFLIAGIGYDYLFGKSAFKPFIGAIIEYGVYKFDFDEKGKNYPMNISGLIYVIQVGLNYKIDSSSSLELGYKFGRSNLKESTMLDANTEMKTKINIENAFFIGYNYKF